MNAGCGGNLISFMLHFNNVTGIELNNERFKMLENNIQEYDFVIFSRYDYLGEIKLDLNEIDMNKLYTGKCGWWRSFSDYVFEDNMLMFHPSKIEFMKVFDNLSRIANEVSLMSELKKYKVPLVMIVEPLLTASYFYNNENTFDFSNSNRNRGSCPTCARIKKILRK